MQSCPQSKNPSYIPALSPRRKSGGQFWPPDENRGDSSGHPTKIRGSKLAPGQKILFTSLPFQRGESVTIPQGKKDPYTNWLSFDQYCLIHTKCVDDLRVYTDGSAPEGLAGSGAAIYKDRNILIHSASVALGAGTNKAAELQAIQYALQWILDNVSQALTESRRIRLFTDSRYAQEALLSTNSKRRHFYLVDSIKALGAKLRIDHAAPVTVHWVPSHIEKTLYGTLPIIGNQKADKLAEAARKRSKCEDSKNQTEKVRHKQVSAISQWLKAMEKLLKKDQVPHHPDGPSSSDDAACSACQEFPNDSSDT